MEHPLQSYCETKTKLEAISQLETPDEMLAAKALSKLEVTKVNAIKAITNINFFIASLHKLLDRHDVNYRYLFCSCFTQIGDEDDLAGMYPLDVPLPLM